MGNPQQKTRCSNRPGKKTEGPSTSLVYLGYLLDATKSQIKIPGEKILRLLELIDNALSHKKFTRKELVSDRVFTVLRKSNALRTSLRSSHVCFHVKCFKKTHHRIRLTQGIKEDLRMWQTGYSMASRTTCICR